MPQLKERRQSPTVARSTRDIHNSGLAISALVGRVFGDVQIRLNAGIPARSTTARTNAAPVGVLPRLHVEPKQLAHDAVGRTLAASALGELRADRLDARNHRGSDTVHHVLTVALEQGHHCSQPVEDRALLRILHRFKEAQALGFIVLFRRPAAPHVVADRFADIAQPAEHRGRIKIAGQQERADLVMQMRTQPRHRGELRLMRNLVHADPQPEVAGIDVELAFCSDDVRSHECQATVARMAVFGWQEQLVLAEHLARKVREQQADLHPGHPRPERTDDRRPHLAGLLRSHLVEQRLHDHLEPADVAFDPSGAVRDKRGLVRMRRGQPR